MDDVVRVKRPTRIPEMLSAREIARVLAQLDGSYRLMASLLNGSGLWLMEAVRLRVKDVNYEYRQIVVRDTKGRRTG